MKKRKVSQMISYIILGAISTSSLIFLLGNSKNINNSLNGQKNNYFLQNENISPLMFQNYFNDGNNYQKLNEILGGNKFNHKVETNTNDSYDEKKENWNWETTILKNRVNEKYLKYVKLNFSSEHSIENAYTSYDKWVSKKEKSISEAMDFEDNNLLENNDLNKSSEIVSIDNISYPFVKRQIFGEVKASTDGFQTIIEFNRASNLPLNSSEYIFTINGSIIDNNGNSSNVEAKDVSISITNNNVGNPIGDNETVLSNYKMVVNKKIIGEIKIELSNINTNHSDMHIENISVIDYSPKIVSSNAKYNKNNGEWEININGQYLNNNNDNYEILINDKKVENNIKVTGQGNTIKINFVSKLDENTSPKLKFRIRGNWQWINPSISEITYRNNAIKQQRLITSSVDSQKNPAGYGSFKFDTIANSYSIKNLNNNADFSVQMNLEQTFNMQIKNKVENHARYNGYSIADFVVKNKVTPIVPNLDPLYDYLVKTITQKSYWDTEFYFGSEELKKFNINALFANKFEKASTLEFFYVDVFKNVFAAKKGDKKYTIGNNGESASDFLIYEPTKWGIKVEIDDVSCYLIFSYEFFDGKMKAIKYPFKSKLFLNNVEKGYVDNYEKTDLSIYEKSQTIDVSNNKNLVYADVYYDLFNNIEGSKHLYENLVQYKDSQINDIDQNVKLIETLFTKNQFYNSLSRMNFINILNVERMIYFSTTDEDGKQYNSWSDLAKGNLKFNIEVGKQIGERFYLKKYQKFVEKSIFTYLFKGFKTQYDIYYNNKIYDEKANQTINLKGYETKSIKSINADWVLENLFVFDNQSGNEIDKRKINPKSDYGDGKLFATNLLKDDFLKLVLKNNIQNIKVHDYTNQDLIDGSITIEVILPNLGDDPSSLKDKILKTKNNSEFTLLTNVTNKDKIWKFKLVGFQKNYDLQYNYSNTNIDANKVEINDTIVGFDKKITANTNDEYSDKLISFDWYSNPNNDSLWEYKLLKTRLSKNEFSKKIESKIQTNLKFGKNGINEFRGIYYGIFDFDSSDTQKKLNAINYNNEETYPVTWSKLTTNKIEFSLFNLHKNIYFDFKQTNINDDYKEYSLNLLSNFRPSELKDPKILLKTLNENGYIEFGTDSSNSNNPFIVTNALNIDDLYFAIDNKVFVFDNIVFDNEEKYLQFDLTINVENGQLNGLDPSSTNNVFKIRLTNLKQGVNELDENKYRIIDLKQINSYFKTNFKYINDIDRDFILNNLFHYSDSKDQPKPNDKPIIADLSASYTKKEFMTLLKSFENFENGVNLVPNSYKEEILIGQIYLSKKIYVNGSDTNLLGFKIKGFTGKANVNWKIENNTTLNIKEFTNKQITIYDFNENFIYKNMMNFSNTNKIFNSILDNSYITYQEFSTQLLPKIMIKKEGNSAYVSIETSKQIKLNQNDVNYSSINFIVNGFDNFSWNTFFNKNKLTLILSSIAIITIIPIIIFVAYKFNKQRKARKD